MGWGIMYIPWLVASLHTRKKTKYKILTTLTDRLSLHSSNFTIDASFLMTMFNDNCNYLWEIVHC